MLEGRTVRVVEDLEDRFFPKLIGKKTEVFKYRIGDAKLDKGYPLKCE